MEGGDKAYKSVMISPTAVAVVQSDLIDKLSLVAVKERDLFVMW